MPDLLSSDTTTDTLSPRASWSLRAPESSGEVTTEVSPALGLLSAHIEYDVSARRDRNSRISAENIADVKRVSLLHAVQQGFPLKKAENKVKVNS